MRGKPLSPEQVEQRRQTARALNLGQYLEAARRERAWPAKHLALLGKLPDAEVADRTGRSANAVRQKRNKLASPLFATGAGAKAAEARRCRGGALLPKTGPSTALPSPPEAAAGNRPPWPLYPRRAPYPLSPAGSQLA